MAKLQTVELGRGLAASAVVLFHMNAAAKHMGMGTSDLFAPFQYGVDFFFVLSGFIIFHVHQDDVGHPECAKSYALKRFIRVMPLLWCVVLGWNLLRTAIGDPPDAAELGTSLLLYPSLTMPVPPVVWTLRHEMVFYLAFVTLLLNRRLGMAVFCLWTLAVLGQMALIAHGQGIGGVPSFFLSAFQLDFVFGAVVAMLARRGLPDSVVPLLLGLAGVVAFGWASLVFDVHRASTVDYATFSNLYIPLKGLAFAVLLYGLLSVERRVRVPRWGLTLGAASYAIYLVHVRLNSFSQVVAAKLGDGLGHALIFVVGVGGGLVVHFLFERPATRYLRSKWLPARESNS